MVELLCGVLVFIFYSNPDFREWLRLTPDKLLKDAILKYMDDSGVQVWMDMIQKQVPKYSLLRLAMRHDEIRVWISDKCLPLMSTLVSLLNSLTFSFSAVVLVQQTMVTKTGSSTCIITVLIST